MRKTPSLTALIAPDGTIKNIHDQHILAPFRLSPADLLGKKTVQLPESPLAKMIDNLAALTSEKGEPINITNQFEYNRTNKLLTGFCCPSPLQDGNLWLFILDATHEHKMAEESFRQEKFNTLARFARGVAHAINNSLVGIIGHASLAEQSLPPYHASRFNIDQLLKAADHTTELAKQLMIYAGFYDTTSCSLHLVTFLKDFLPLIKAGISEHVEIILEQLSNDTPLVVADAKLLQDAMISALSSLTFSASSSNQLQVHISINQQKLPPDSEELHTLAGKIQAGDYASLNLRIAGANFKPAQLRQLFDPFQNAQQSGSGMGAASLLAVARVHNGGLNAFIDNEKNLNICLLLPAIKKEPPHLQHDIRKQTFHFKPDGIALVIDDEPAVREVSGEILTQLGFEVLKADSGETGLDAATKNIEKLTLVLLDLHMPSLGGAETFRGLRLIQPRLRILISSGYSQKDAMRHFPVSPGTAFLQKPYRMEELKSAVLELFNTPI